MSIELVELITNDSRDNFLGLKPTADQKPQSWFKSKRSPWISEASSKRIEHKRNAYLAIYHSYQGMDKNSPTAKQLEQALISLSAGEVPKLAANLDVKRLSKALKNEDAREFDEFVKTLTDARPFGIVKKGRKIDGRNEHLAELITLFTYIYEEKPQNNPLLYGFPKVTAQDMLVGDLDINQPGARREAVERYMAKIAQEIERLNAMSPQELGMTFSDDNVKHVAIVQKLKRAFNRLSAQLEYGKRFTNLPAGQYDLVVVQELPKNSEIASGKIYLLDTDDQVYCLRNPDGDVKFGTFAGHEYSLEDQKEEKKASKGVKEKKASFKEIRRVNFADLIRDPTNPMRKAAFLAETANRGHTSTNLLAREYDLVVADPAVLRDPKKNVKSGKIYLVFNGDYYVRDPRGNLQKGSLSVEGIDCVDLAGRVNDPIFKDAILSITSPKGHTYAGEKTNHYHLEDCPRGAECEHEILQSKISMRRKKLGIFWLSLVFAVLIAVGQVAIAVFTATGIFAIAIGISCGITNIFLFARDIKGVMLSLVKGDLTRGLSIPAKLTLGLWLVVSLATALVAGGLVMVSLVALFGFALQTAPVWLAIGAGIIATLTVIGMASLFFQVGAGFAKSLRGKTLRGLIIGGWESLKSFFRIPELNKETQDLKAQVEAYKAAIDSSKIAAGGSNQWKSSAAAAGIMELREQYRPIRGHLRRELFAHYARYGAKLFFTVFFVPAALIAAVVATYAFSVISATGTADTMKVVLGWSDKMATTVSNVLTWGFSAIVNGALSAKNLFIVGVALAGSVSKVTVGLAYGVATVVNLAYHGKLWQTIKNGAQAFRMNPLKSFIPALRAGLAVAFGVAIALNGYGNGATAGGGAINETYMPNWLLGLVTPSTLTVILATASSMALNKAAIDDAYKADTPMMKLENPAKPVEKKRKGEEFEAFFDTKVRPSKKAFDPMKAGHSRDADSATVDDDTYDSSSSNSPLSLSDDDHRVPVGTYG